MVESIFYQLYVLINDLIFGGAVSFDALEPWMPLIVGLLTAFGTVLLFALPFLAVVMFCKVIFAGWFGGL